MQTASISSLDQLEALLSEPTQAAIESISKLQGDILILGAGGKMGPSLAYMSKRAVDASGISRRVIAVSRFTSGDEEAKLQSWGIDTIHCDLLDGSQLRELPDAPNVVFMAGVKFGSTGNESLTWAMNSYLPGKICEKYGRSKIIAFSSGNIYGMTPVAHGGSLETDPSNPSGEYAASVLGRERIFEHFSKTRGIPCAIIRLNYACELRYGVLVDIAQRVFACETIDLSMGYANVIWQGDANAMALAAFDRASSPPFILNVAGPEIISVRRVAEQFAELLGKAVTFCGSESPEAILSNGELGYKLFGYPTVSVEQMVIWIADWIAKGGTTLNKPTHFETRDGKY